MKKIVSFFLLLTAALAASAQTPDQTPKYEPRWGVQYDCSYVNYSGPATHPYGWSNWTIRVRSNPSLIWATENFQVPYLKGSDNHAVAWAIKSEAPPPNSSFTTWESTDGTVQCKDTRVYAGSYMISFQSCNDGHSRFCRVP
jgi:hypothetical protein